MPLGADEGEPVEDLGVGARLAVEAAQVVAVALDLVAVKAVVDYREVDARRAVLHSELADEPRAVPPDTEVRDERVAQGVSVVDESEGKLPGGLLRSDPHRRRV